MQDYRFSGRNQTNIIMLYPVRNYLRLHYPSNEDFHKEKNISQLEINMNMWNYELLEQATLKVCYKFFDILKITDALSKKKICLTNETN